jgi:hypothetical protein
MSWSTGLHVRSHKAGVQPKEKSMLALRTALLTAWLSGLTCLSALAQDAPACAPDQELHAGQCYPKCDNGFKADGALCKQVCPERTQDTGTHCLSGPAQFRKKFYERAPAAN